MSLGLWKSEGFWKSALCISDNLETWGEVVDHLQAPLASMGSSQETDRLMEKQAMGEGSQNNTSGSPIPVAHWSKASGNWLVLLGNSSGAESLPMSSGEGWSPLFLGVYLSLQVKPCHYQLGITSNSEPRRVWVSLWGLFPELSDPRVH